MRQIPLYVEHIVVGVGVATLGYLLYLFSGEYRFIVLVELGLGLGLILVTLYFVSPYSPYRNKQK